MPLTTIIGFILFMGRKAKFNGVILIRRGLNSAGTRDQRDIRAGNHPLTGKTGKDLFVNKLLTMAYTKKAKNFTKAGVKAKPRKTATSVVSVTVATKVEKPNKKHKQRERISSEAINPKYAKKDFMMEVIAKAAGKEQEKEDAKIARKVAVQKYLESKKEKKEDKKSLKQDKLEQTKQKLVEAQKSKKSDGRKAKAQAKTEASRPKKAEPEKPTKRVRFA